MSIWRRLCWHAKAHALACLAMVPTTLLCLFALDGWGRVLAVFAGGAAIALNYILAGLRLDCHDHSLRRNGE